ncbi:RNA polymerase sigma factor [Leucothrix arctica]|uniref:RNA polymerase subunit sigma-70 n=1 Tax=Leucothrix arctica TaxID=1481894 RepID=A0A317C3I5_9GAMM|nr:RNA polymerase sigma factor [Leucothrix arctica]PWQ93184.1 hypothetical protein DKT75_21090 [Leucothrix arctica]
MPSQSEQEVRKGLPALLPRMWRYSLVLSKKRDIADDLTQSGAERALNKASQYQSGTRLDAWTFSIISSIWKNQLRSDSVRRGQGVQSVDEVELEAVGSDSETNIFGVQVLNLVMKLPSEQKDVVFLVYVEGYSYKEAASVLDIPIGTVMSRLAAGRKKINEAVNATSTTKQGGL